MRFVYSVVLLLLILVSCNRGGSSRGVPPLQNPELDAGFGSSGVVSVGAGSAYDVAVDTQGRVIAVGQASDPASLVVVRLLDDGSFDPSFGTDGVVEFNSGLTLTDRARAIVVDTQNRLTVVGSSGLAPEDVVLWRFLEDGSLDPSFGVQGIASFPDPGGLFIDEPRDLGLDSQNRIVVVGSSYGGAPGASAATVWRFLDDGTADTTLGGSGFVRFPDPETGVMETVVLDSSDAILAAGQKAGVFAVWRLLVDGTLDPAFGMGGVFESTEVATASAAVLEPTGRLLVCGAAELELAVWALTPTGQLDPTWGSKGIIKAALTGDLGTLRSAGHGISIDSVGRVVVGGDAGIPATTFVIAPGSSFFYSVGGFDGGSVVWRFNSNGFPDQNFGDDGVITAENILGGGQEVAVASVVDAQDRALVAGSARASTGFPSFQFTIWRFRD